MANLRAEYPEVLAHSIQWGADETAILYGRSENPRRDSIVRYYSYIDLGLEFCNTALSAAAKGWIAPDVFANHYQPLVRHLLSENHPFVSFALPGAVPLPLRPGRAGGSRSGRLALGGTTPAARNAANRLNRSSDKDADGAVVRVWW